MFKMTLTVVMATLCLNFSAQAQESKFRPLKIGDTIPKILWNLPMQVMNHPEGKHTTTLKEYKEKLIIIDFWATWCSPCLAMLPKTNSLQKRYAREVQFLPVTRESESKINALIKKTGWNPMQQLSHFVNDTVLNQLFPHQGIPHYAWINKHGIVQAITGAAEVNDTTIFNVLANTELKIPQKKDLRVKDFDVSKALLNNEALTTADKVSSITLGPYQPGLSSFTFYGNGALKNRRLLIFNDLLINLYRMAYASQKHYSGGIHLGYPRNRVIAEFKDPDYWFKNENRLCYDQIMPDTNTAALRSLMQLQLNLLLPVKAKIETRNLACYILVNEGVPVKKIKATDTLLQHNPLHLQLHNQPAENLSEILNLYLGFKRFIVVDETENKRSINIELKASLSELQSVQTALKPWGLALKPSIRNIEVLVITDKIN